MSEKVKFIIKVLSSGTGEFYAFLLVVVFAILVASGMRYDDIITLAEKLFGV